MSQTPSDTFKLSYPFTTAAGTRIELVELKRLTVKDLKQGADAGAGAAGEMVPVSAGGD